MTPLFLNESCIHRPKFLKGVPCFLTAKEKAETTVKTAALQKALQEAELKIKALNTLIDVAEEQLKISIRKKSGAKQS